MHIRQRIKTRIPVFGQFIAAHSDEETVLALLLAAWMTDRLSSYIRKKESHRAHLSYVCLMMCDPFLWSVLAALCLENLPGGNWTDNNFCFSTGGKTQWVDNGADPWISISIPRSCLTGGAMRRPSFMLSVKIHSLWVGTYYIQIPVRTDSYWYTVE